MHIFQDAYDDINGTLGYQKKIGHFVELFIYFLGLYPGLPKSGKLFWCDFFQHSIVPNVLVKGFLKSCFSFKFIFVMSNYAIIDYFMLL